MSKLTSEQLQLIADFRQNFPNEAKELRDEQILSILDKTLDKTTLSEDEQISIMGFNNIKEEYENFDLKNSLDSKVKELLIKKTSAIESEKIEAEKSESFIGKCWNWLKNSLNIGDSSNDILAAQKEEKNLLKTKTLDEAFEEITGVEATKENKEKFLNSELKTKSETALEDYKEGQEEASDLVGDLISGVGAMVAYTAGIAAITALGAPVLLAGGLALLTAGAIGAGTKIATKSAGDKDYTTLGKDFATGFINGLIAPIGAGFGGAIAKKVIGRFGGKAAKEGIELIAKKGVEKSSEKLIEKGSKGTGKFLQETLLNPTGYKYEGSKLATGIAYTTEFGIDGFISGSADAAVRTKYEGGSTEEIVKSALIGGTMGAAGAISFGSFMKKIGNFFHKKGAKTGETIRESIIEQNGKIHNINLKTSNKLLKEKGLSDDLIQILREKNAYNEVIIYLQLYEKYIPEAVKEMIDSIKKEVISMPPSKQDYAPECLEHFGEILFLAEKHFGHIEKSQLPDIISQLFSKDGNSVIKNLQTLKQHGEVFKNVTKSSYIDDILENINLTTDKKLLNKKLELIEKFSLADDGSLNNVYRLIEDSTPEDIDLRIEALHLFEKDNLLKDKVADILKKKPEAIKLILKIYKDTKNNPDIWDNPVENLLKIEHHNINDYSNIHSLKTKLHKIGININASHYDLIRLSENLKNDYQISLLKELQEEFPEALEKDSFQYEIIDAIGQITNNAQKDLIKYSIINKKGLHYEKGILSLVKEDWQASTAIRMYKEGIEPSLVKNVIERNISKEIDDYIDTMAITSRTSKFVAKEIAYAKSNAHIMFKIRNADSKLLTMIDTVEEYQLPFFEKMAILAKNDPRIIDWYHVSTLSKNLDSELKVNYAMDILEHGGDFENVMRVFVLDDEHFIHLKSELGIENIYKNKIFEEVPFEPYTYEILAKFSDKDLVDKFLKLKNDNNLKEVFGFGRFFSADRDTAKAQFAFLDEVLKNNPDYIKNHCKDFFGRSELFYDDITLEQCKLMSLGYKRVLEHKEIPIKDVESIASAITKENESMLDELLNSTRFASSEDKIQIAYILQNIKEANIDIAKILLRDNSIPTKEISHILFSTNSTNHHLVKELLNDKSFPLEFIGDIAAHTGEHNISYATELCKNYRKMELSVNQIPFLLDNTEYISHKDLQKLNKILGINNVNTFSKEELLIATQLTDLAKKITINEIPLSSKKNILRKLVACNQGLFSVSENMMKFFPLLPTSREQYCEFLPTLVRSMGIEINPLNTSQINKFFNSAESLGHLISKISDKDFGNLKIKQDFSKEDFIQTVLEKLKNLSSAEKQKVYDYFCFELAPNKHSKIGYSINGYPVNLNNGKKLAEISNPETKEVVELLRKDVIRFSENNPIKCDNPDIEKLLNEIMEVLPEFRTTIGKTQHGSHHFDVAQHSLKVLQKISQDPNFSKLTDSDKKVMTLASLLHDITKREGKGDATHATESAFDTFFIAKKFGLTIEEENKLHALINYHEWLGYVNTAKTEEELTKRLQSVAYDLQHDNTFELALMFTHADLKAVKVDDAFHNSTHGPSRIDFNGNVRSFGDAADFHAEKIRTYINELKKSQPLLPVTKIPDTSTIEKAIAFVNSDGSTNIKGVYKDKDGLVVIKFNEVEDWEAIGFPKGSISRGFKISKGGMHDTLEDIDTGNIKFFAHGLDFANQLAKFDAFALPNSRVLLSVSYTERPESKYRFFRPQGLLLDVDTKYIHGGGNTDAGSGCGKFVDEFKKNYIFGGPRESDRLYISNLIKKATNMTDDEYIKFVEKYQNKAVGEIEPLELQEKIIEAFASINSNTRKGERNYNEMYISNPKKVMAVFAYNMVTGEKLGNPIDFLNRQSLDNNIPGLGGINPNSVYERTEFLRKYALERNLPFIVFGD